jgi:hypothetical protein
MSLLKRLKLTPTQASLALKNRRVKNLPVRNLACQVRQGARDTSGQGVGKKGRFSDGKSESKENIISS